MASVMAHEVGIHLQDAFAAHSRDKQGSQGTSGFLSVAVLAIIHSCCPKDPSPTGLLKLSFSPIFVDRYAKLHIRHIITGSHWFVCVCATQGSKI